MQNALLALRNRAHRSGFALSFELFGSPTASNSDAYLVRVKMITDSVSQISIGDTFPTLTFQLPAEASPMLEKQILLFARNGCGHCKHLELHFAAIFDSIGKPRVWKHWLMQTGEACRCFGSLSGGSAGVIPNSTAQPATVAQPVQLSDEQLDGVQGGQNLFWHNNFWRIFMLPAVY